MAKGTEELQHLGTFLLHIKALIWCLCKAGERYNLTKIVKALRERRVPQELMDSTVGQNLSFIIGFLNADSDYETLITALTTSIHDIQARGGKKAEVHHPSGIIICEVGHYIEAVEDIDTTVPAGSYGVLSALKDGNVKGLFYVEGHGLRLVECEPGKVRFIFGTTIWGPRTDRR